MKKVLFVTSEAVPFIKTGGLADVTGSLPKYFDKKKYDVRIMIPKYLCIEEKLTADLENLGNFSISLGWREQYVGVFHKVVEGVTYYFIDNEYYFGGDQPYNRIYEDVEKFAFFSKAAIAAMKFIDFQADIIHCHDWQTGMVPVFLALSGCIFKIFLWSGSVLSEDEDRLYNPQSEISGKMEAQRSQRYYGTAG